MAFFRRFLHELASFRHADTAEVSSVSAANNFALPNSNAVLTVSPFLTLLNVLSSVAPLFSGTSVPQEVVNEDSVIDNSTLPLLYGIMENRLPLMYAYIQQQIFFVLTYPLALQAHDTAIAKCLKNPVDHPILVNSQQTPAGFSGHLDAAAIRAVL